MYYIKYFLFLTLAATLLSACKKETSSGDNLQASNGRNGILILGHGGMGSSNFYPMNSYESIVNCLNIGSDGTELDVQMTKDSVLVAYHDETLETLTDGTGRVIDHTWQELQNIKYQPAPYIEYDLASLDTLFRHLDNLNQLVFSFDNKLYFDAPQKAVFTRAVIRLLERYQMEQNVFIESHDIDFLVDFKALKDYKFFLNPASFEDGLALADSNQMYGIIMDDENITAAQIDEAHSYGLHVQTWGPASKDANIEAVQKNPDAIQTNNVNVLVDLFK
jgi:glycerophosphoryl diester phosphodiesterase